MAEFALVLPVLVLLILAVIQLGVVFNSYVTLTDAVRAGARQGAVARFLPPADREAAVEDAVRDSAENLDQDKLAVPPAASSWESGEPVTVTATYPYEINLLGLVVSSGDLSSTTTERVE